MSRHTLSDVESLARQAAGNWQHFDSFAWWTRPEDNPEDWCIVYTSNRDSGLIDQSNEAVIQKELSPWEEGDDPDVVPESHNHWACGYVSGYALRVYRNGEITEAFRHWCDLQASLEDYPLLDESDYSEREYKAALSYIEDAGRRFVKDDPPEGWAGEVFSWLWENDQRQLESVDDRGGYPSKESVVNALFALGILDPDVAAEFYG